MTGPNDPLNEDALAAEFVLRLLDAEDHLRFEKRLRDDAELRELVHQWEVRLAAIAEELEDVTPPTSIKTEVLSRILAEPRDKPVSRNWLLGLFGAVAVAFAVVTVGPLLQGPSELVPEFQSELVSSDGDLVLIAGVIPATHEIVIDRVAGAAPEGRVLELWLIAKDADAPVSLGLLQAEGTTRIRVPDDIAPSVRSGTIAVSEEPVGGSPAGVPTGEVLATGTFADL